jgi:tRNA(Met) cytidine acetyltransferase
MHSRLLSQLLQWQQQAARLQIRLPVVWQGERDDLLAQCRLLLQQHQATTLYWLGDNAPQHAIQLSHRQNYQLLGSECDMLVINAFSGFNADLVAASAGCVKAGGIWLLLCPPFAQWRQQPNTAHKNLLPYPLDANTHQGHFIPFWLNQLQQQNVLLLENQTLITPLNWPAAPEPFTATAPCVTADQTQAVQAILHVVSGHRRRPLVLTADRGRGKSAALGIAAAQLINTATAAKQVVITAPSPQAAQTTLKHFQQLTDLSQHGQLQFIPFDQLLRDKPKADLLLVDEAAAIPTPVLQQLLAQFSRIIFATTEHGYEGTGRGFQLRFMQHLSEQCPKWHKLQLQQPIRYQQQDPLEQLIFSGFLLRQSLATPEQVDVATLQYCQYQASGWLDQPDKLQQVFSLLSLAHYQTQVKDLAALLDNSQLRVFTLEQQGQVLACALISIEGSISTSLTNAIYQGERRLQGHLLAQSLAFHLARPELAQLPLWRVMRIAVQPALQRQQLGSNLLQYIADAAKQQQLAYLGTSFAASPELIHFWQQAGYQPVRLGHSSDNASAEYSVLMLRAINGDADVVYAMQHDFSQQLYWRLAHYPRLNTRLLLQLIAPPPQAPLTAGELTQLALFFQGKRPYELVSHLLLSWFNLHYKTLEITLQLELAALFWQQRSWVELQQQFGYNSMKAMLTEIGKRLHNGDYLSCSTTG